jgi:hypothetical protein
MVEPTRRRRMRLFFMIVGRPLFLLEIEFARDANQLRRV